MTGSLVIMTTHRAGTIQFLLSSFGPQHPFYCQGTLRQPLRRRGRGERGGMGVINLVLLLQLCELLVLLDDPLLDVQLHLLLTQPLSLCPSSCCCSFPALGCSLFLCLHHNALLMQPRLRKLPTGHGHHLTQLAVKHVENQQQRLSLHPCRQALPTDSVHLLVTYCVCDAWEAGDFGEFGISPGNELERGPAAGHLGWQPPPWLLDCGPPGPFPAVQWPCPWTPAQPPSCAWSHLLTPIVISHVSHTAQGILGRLADGVLHWAKGFRWYGEHAQFGTSVSLHTIKTLFWLQHCSSLSKGLAGWLPEETTASCTLCCS